MKKGWILLTVLLALLLCACGVEEGYDPELMITRAPQSETQAQEMEIAVVETQDKQEVVLREAFSFQANGAELIPGVVFDASVLPEVSSIYQVPSCAIVGTDNVYNYETFELTAFDDGEKEVIYSILLLDPNITTDEGLALGDPAEKVLQLYGSDYVQEGTAWIYPAEKTMLCVIVQADHVVSIEYRMETE
jgi:hypothetical protein